MKNLLAVLIVISLVAIPALFASSYEVNLGGVIAVNGTSLETDLRGFYLKLINDGGSNVYFKLNGANIDLATTDDFFIAPNEDMTFTAQKEHEFRYLRARCSGTNTSALRYISY